MAKRSVLYFLFFKFFSKDLSSKKWDITSLFSYLLILFLSLVYSHINVIQSNYSLSNILITDHSRILKYIYFRYKKINSIHSSKKFYFSSASDAFIIAHLYTWYISGLVTEYRLVLVYILLFTQSCLSSYINLSVHLSRFHIILLVLFILCKPWLPLYVIKR